MVELGRKSWSRHSLSFSITLLEKLCGLPGHTQRRQFSMFCFYKVGKTTLGSLLDVDNFSLSTPHPAPCQPLKIVILASTSKISDYSLQGDAKQTQVILFWCSQHISCVHMLPNMCLYIYFSRDFNGKYLSFESIYSRCFSLTICYYLCIGLFIFIRIA